MAVNNTNNQQIAGLDDKTLFEIKGWDAIQERCEIAEIDEIVEQNLQKYYTINVEDAMKKLTQVGQLLQLAYSGSKGYSCSTVVLKVLSGYQDLVKESVLTSSTFVEVVLKALSFHKLAIILTEKNKNDKALTMLTKCAEFAQRMADESNKLVVKSDTLSKLSENALLKANDNRNVSEEEKKKMITQLNDYKKKKAEHESMGKELDKQIEEVEQKHASAATKHESLSYFAAWMKWFRGKTGDELDLEARARGAKVLKRELLAKARESNSELAGIVEALKNSNVEKDELENAIMSLELTIKTLGKVKTIFQNTKRFWEGVHKQCKSLTVNDELMALCDEDLKDELLKEIKQSGYCWLSLGKINRCAALSIQAVDKTVDNIMNDLPTKEEADGLIGELAAKIIGDIEKENKMIERNMTSE